MSWRLLCVGALLAGLLALTGCGEEDAKGCDSDLECKGERVCVARQCVSPDAPLTASDGAVNATSRDATVSTDGANSVEAGPVDSAPVDAASSEPTPPRDAAVSSVPDAAAPPIVAGKAIRTDVLAQNVIADGKRKRFYAVVAGSAAKYANQLVTVDAETAAVLDAVAVGSEPRALAISDDGSTLWVALNGASAVRRVDLGGSYPAPADQYPLPQVGFGSYALTARDVVVLAGAPRSIALSLHMDGVSPSLAGVVVLDDGVARMNLGAGHTGASALTGGPAGWLFGFNDGSTGAEFFTLELDAEGITEHPYTGLVGLWSDILFASGYVYATTGDVVDVRKPDAPTRAGKLPVAGPVLATSKPGVVLHLSNSDPASGQSDGSVVLRTLDVASFTATAMATIAKQKDASEVLRIAAYVEPGWFAYTTQVSYDQPGGLYVAKKP